MEGDEKPLDDFRREMQQALQQLWAKVNDHTGRIQGLSETLENMQEQRNQLR